MASCSCTSVAATLKRRITIQNIARRSDGQGGFDEAWSDGETVSASIEPVKSYERYQAMQMQTPVSHKIVMRYRGDVTTASRLKYGTRYFWVKEVINVAEDSRFLNIKAIERSAADATVSWDSLDLNWQDIG